MGLLEEAQAVIDPNRSASVRTEQGLRQNLRNSIPGGFTTDELYFGAAEAGSFGGFTAPGEGTVISDTTASTGSDFQQGTYQYASDTAQDITGLDLKGLGGLLVLVVAGLVFLNAFAGGLGEGLTG